MTVRRPWPSVHKVVGVLLLLGAILAVSILRVPATAYVGYHHSVEFRPHRSHLLPNTAIVDDVFHAPALVSFSTLLCLCHIEYSAKLVTPVEVSSLIPNLRC